MNFGKQILPCLALALFCAGVARGAQTASPPPPPVATLPPGPALDLINERCSTCHTVGMISSKHKTADAWAATVQQMADRGAEISPEEMAVIVEYLAKNLPSAPAAGKPPAKAG
jgi:mono/diheme cytochrome c family protein